MPDLQHDGRTSDGETERGGSRDGGAGGRQAAEMGIDPEHLLDFEAAKKRGLSERLAIGVRTHKPVIDDAGFRAFGSTAEYRRWCNDHVPAWLGYGSDWQHRTRAAAGHPREAPGGVPVPRQDRRGAAGIPRHDTGRRPVRRENRRGTARA